MAINRYTQPVQAQYIPTTPNVQLVTALLQKQAQEQAMASNALSTFESDLLKSKAYGDKDKATLAEKQKYYKGKLGELYDQYGSNPGLMLSAMRDINREYTQDITAGDLARINQTYAQAQEDIKDAQERYSKGNLMPWAYRQQMDQAGTGFRAVQGSDYFDNAIDRYVSTSNWYNKVSGGDYNQALQTAWKGFLSDPEIQSQVQYMNDTEKAMLEQQFNSAFQSRWNAIKPKDKTTSGSGADDIYVGSDYFNFVNTGAETGYDPLQFRFDDDLYDENGDIDLSKADDVASKASSSATRYQRMRYPGSQTFESSASMAGEIANRIIKQKSELDNARKIYNIPSNLSDKEAVEKINGIRQKYSVQFSAVAVPKDTYTDVMQEKLIDGNDMINLIGRDVRIKGDKNLYKNFDDVADKLGFGNLEEFVEANKHVSKKGGVQMSGFEPGALVYMVKNNKGDEVPIEISPESNDIKSEFGPSWDIQNSIRNNEVGVGKFNEFTYGPAYIGIYDPDTEKRVDAITASGYEIIPDAKNETYNVYALTKDNSGNFIPLLDDDGERVELDPEQMFAEAAGGYGYDRIEKENKAGYTYEKPTE